MITPRRFAFFAGLMLLAAQSGVHGAVLAPLHIGTTNRIVNQFGRTSPGSATVAALFNQPVVAGDLIHIIRTFNGIIDAPDTNGLPVGTNNVIVATTYVGAGVDPAVGQIGQFGFSLSDYDGSPIFCRIFNSHDLPGASFYGDSQVYVPASGYSVFIPVISAVKPLDAVISDSSGLNNSWIKLLGGVPTNFPGANGGATYASFIAGTTKGDIGSFVRMTQVMPGLDGSNLVFWYSLTGLVYQVEFTPDIGSSEYNPVGDPVTATDWVSQISHAGGLSGTNASYRVKLLNQ